MDGPERELLLAVIDAELNDNTLARIERVRLLDLWWRVATNGPPHVADLGQAEREFLSQLLRRMALAEMEGSAHGNRLAQVVAAVLND
jgi:hypothetical protein